MDENFPLCFQEALASSIGILAQERGRQSAFIVPILQPRADEKYPIFVHTIRSVPETWLR